MTRCFVVPGEPRGKGRPRFSRNGTYTDSETSAYEKKIVVFFRKELGSYKAPDTAFLRIQVIAYMGIPKSATVSQKQAMAAGRLLPSRKPDVDNICKIVLDALNGVAYRDDARVHEIRCCKFYSFEPRLEISLEEV